MKLVSLSKAIDLVSAIRNLLNTKVPAKRSIKRRMKLMFFMMVRQAEHIAQYMLETDQSEGPSLSSEWMMEKERWWNGMKWYVVSKKVASQTMNNPSMAGMTMQVPKPWWARGAQHKNAFTGFLHDNIESWMYRKLKTTRILYGYKHDKPHPVTGYDLFKLLTMIHMGGGIGTRPIPPRPFLDAAVTIDEMVKMVGKELIEMFKDVTK